MVSGHARCRNYWGGHEKGHQFFRRRDENGRREGPTLLVGDFVCTWEPEELIKSLYADIRKYEGSEIWMAYLDTAKRSGVCSVRSNRTCFTCLSECPVFILPCERMQHAICEECAMRFSYDFGRSQATLCLQRCPLGCRFKNGKPWHSRIKPSTAGVRILSLDG